MMTYGRGFSESAVPSGPEGTMRESHSPFWKPPARFNGLSVKGLLGARLAKLRSLRCQLTALGGLERQPSLGSCSLG